MVFTPHTQSSWSLRTHSEIRTPHSTMMTKDMKTSLTIANLLALGCALVLAGCDNPFKQKDYLGRQIPYSETHTIDVINLPEQSTTQPASVEQDAVKVAKGIVDVPPPLEKVELTLSDVRAASLVGNLELAVELYNPSIAQTTVDFERAKFEWAFVASYQHINTD